MSNWNLPKEVVALSRADNFEAARHEWDLIDRDIDPDCLQNCVCGKDGLRGAVATWGGSQESSVFIV